MNFFDLHCDTLVECYENGASLANNSFGVSLKMKQALGLWAQVFAIWIPAKFSGDRAWDYYQRVTDFFRQELAVHSNRLSQIRTGIELDAAFAAGKCAGILAVENASAIGGDLRRLERMARDGVKIITLTWNGENEVAHGAQFPSAHWRRAGKHTPALCSSGGLKPFGRQLLREMSALNVAADVSHLNARSFWDVIDFDLPILASHSNCRSVYDHPRALSDAQIRTLAERGIPLGLTFAYLRARQGRGAFASCRDWSAIYKNAAYALMLGAADILCVGTDYDGTPAPRGLETTPQLINLRGYLARRGLSRDILDKMFFDNTYGWFKREFIL
ncbi:MAG: dipeptidase [Oscillospiraceae bacterium]|jgi:membrane dipeptidase|nr:dipeptidase [Oscillospiraceae bacterium]